MNPMPDGTYSPLDDVRPWDSLSDDEKRLFSRMAEVFAGFSEYTDAPGRPDRRLPRGDGPARQHADPLLRRQRRLRRGQPQRLGQREQVLQRLAGRDGGEPQAARRARQPGHLQPLPDRLGVRVLDAVPDVQALQLPGRRLRPARRSTGRPGSRRRARCASSTTTRSTSSRRSSTCCGLEFPETLNGHEQVPLPGASMRYSFDDAARRRNASASTTRCSARAGSGSRAGRRSPCTGRRRASATSTTTGGSSSTPTRTAPRRTTSPPSIRRS